MQQDLTDGLLELVRLSSTDLPADVEASLHEARDREDEGSAAESVFGSILENVKLARENSTPICQDTGTPIFYVFYPEWIFFTVLPIRILLITGFFCLDLCRELHLRQM